MDVKTYYQKIRDVEATIPNQYAVLKSMRTDDGGKAGVMVEVPKRLAAKMVVEDSAELADADEAAAFRLSQEVAYKAALEASAASRMEVTMVPSQEFKRLADDMKKLKGGIKGGEE